MYIVSIYMYICTCLWDIIWVLGKYYHMQLVWRGVTLCNIISFVNILKLPVNFNVWCIYSIAGLNYGSFFRGLGVLNLNVLDAKIFISRGCPSIPCANFAYLYVEMIWFSFVLTLVNSHQPENSFRWLHHLMLPQCKHTLPICDLFWLVLF